MKSGTRPQELDERDFSFAQTFGAITPIQLPSEYSVDNGITMPDQNADGNPYSCTAYTTTDLGTDQDGIVYEPKYTYMKTLYLQGLPPETNGSDIRPALKSAKIYGLLPKESVPENIKEKDEDYTANQANWNVELDKIAGLLEHRKSGYFNIYEDGGQDWFDSFRSALYLNRNDKRGISVGTPWFNEWTSPQAGVLTDSFVYNGANLHSWHNWAIKGWTSINGTPYLIGKPWLGKNWGANGFCYVSRETINKVMEIRGSIAFTLKDATPEDIRPIQLGIIETILHYLYRMLGLVRLA